MATVVRVDRRGELDLEGFRAGLEEETVPDLALDLVSGRREVGEEEQARGPRPRWFARLLGAVLPVNALGGHT